MPRNHSKFQAKNKIKVDRKLNKIFGKGQSFEEAPESIDTREVFENYYQRLKRQIEVMTHSIGDRIIPERKMVIEQPSNYIPKDNDEILAISANVEKEDRSFIINRNVCQKPRDFSKIDALDLTVHNFPKAEPSLKRSFKLEKVEDLHKKLSELPKTAPRKANTRLENANNPDNVVYIIPSDKHSHTYINGDLRYFNFDFLTEKVGHFDGKILLDSFSYFFSNLDGSTMERMPSGRSNS